ncbi:hypothetical protein, partial [Sphingobium jiangsuense]
LLVNALPSSRLSVLRPIRMSKFLDDLAIWAGLIIDRLSLNAPEEYEDEIAETCLFLVIPALAIGWKAMLNDNDN